MKRIFVFFWLAFCGLSAVADETRFHEGYQLIRVKRFKEAIAVLTPLAEAGHADAQYWLGLSYRLGRPDQDFSDLEAALHWYREAVKNQQPYALWRLGKGEYLYCQLFNSCADKNARYLDEARAIWRKRAEQGDGEGMYHIGIRDLGWRNWIPYYGDYARVEWMKKAIEHGYPRAVGELYYVLRDLGGEDNQKEILTWLRIAAGKGDSWAQTRLGSVAESPEERLSWIQKAAAQNYAEGIFASAYSYELGQDVEQDFAKAAFYYCILTRHSGARDACRDMCWPLPESTEARIAAD